MLILLVCLKSWIVEQENKERRIIAITIETNWVTTGFAKILSFFDLNEVCFANSNVSKIIAIRIPKIDVVAPNNISKKLAELIEARFSGSDMSSGLKYLSPI